MTDEDGAVKRVGRGETVLKEVPPPPPEVTLKKVEDSMADKWACAVTDLATPFEFKWTLNDKAEFAFDVVSESDFESVIEMDADAFYNGTLKCAVGKLAAETVLGNPDDFEADLQQQEDIEAADEANEVTYVIIAVVAVVVIFTFALVLTFVIRRNRQQSEAKSDVEKVEAEVDASEKNEEEESTASAKTNEDNNEEVANGEVASNEAINTSEVKEEGKTLKQRFASFFNFSSNNASEAKEAEESKDDNLDNGAVKDKDFVEVNMEDKAENEEEKADDEPEKKTKSGFFGSIWNKIRRPPTKSETEDIKMEDKKPEEDKEDEVGVEYEPEEKPEADEKAEDNKEQEEQKPKNTDV